ncbi:ankyrin repeat domain-containing protein 26-like [Dama dama]|uniref:ankyrin repeat domain-containing protein 26-like n=1 Tax=Dama dama TaxID=30532 RepID=UPI002A36FFCC|nr:ankyrin repeat domain-containing protein 26-like [Dama dama]
MKKTFGFRSKKGSSPFGSSISPGRDGSHRIDFQPGYRIRDKDLGKIHRAASVGSVAKVQQVLLLGKSGLNDKDKMNRTALHLACANGHPAVVALLLQRRCLPNLCDSENKTALMKAVECQEEECATLLLEHGADPNLTDDNGNTALHHAVFCQNLSLAAKLLSYNAHIEARNKDGLTPVLLAVRERRGEMVEFLVDKAASVRAVDKMERTALMLAIKHESPEIVRLLLQQGVDIFSQDVFGWTAEEYAADSSFNIFRQLISEYKEKRPETSPEKSNPADESSEEDSSRRFPSEPGVDVGPPSNNEVLDFKTKHVVKPKLTKLMKPSQQSNRNIEAKCGILRPESTTFSEDSNSDSNIEDVVETFPKPSPWFEGICQPAFPSPEPVPKLLKSVAGLGPTKVSDSGRKAKGLLRKSHMQDEIAMPRLEIDTVKNQNQEKEKKCFEDTEIVKGENDYPQKAIKLNKETLTETIFQHTGQLNVPVAENTMLNPELENAKRSKERLETEVESYHSRLAAAIHNHDQGQISQRHLSLASQKAKDKRLRLQDPMKFDMAKLKSDNEMLSQQLSKVENKFNKLKIKLHQTRDDLREKTLMLERVQRDLRQAECQKQDIGHMYQNEQGKVKEYLGKQESLEERLSQLQSENMLLRQQLDNAQNRADSKEKTVISIQDQFQQIVKNLHAEYEKHGLMLEERSKDLINKLNHLEERMCQYENEKAERQAVVRQLRQELAESLKKQSASELSLEVMSRYHAKLEVEARDLKNLHQLTSQSQETQDQHREAVRCAEKTQDHIQKLEIENAELQTTVKKQAGEIEQLQKNLLSIRLIDDLPAELETVCSQCLHMNAKIQVLREELLFMTGMQKKCEELEKNNKKLEQEIVNLKSHTEMNMTEHSQVEQYKQEIEERARQELVEKLKEVDTVLQIQAASQENLKQAEEEHIAFLRSQMELRIKELASEVFKLETSEADLEKYKKLYLEGVKVRKSLEKKLDKTNRRLAEMSTELEVEKQQNRSLLSTLTTRPVLEPTSQKKFP